MFVECKNEVAPCFHLLCFGVTVWLNPVYIFNNESQSQAITIGSLTGVLLGFYSSGLYNFILQGQVTL